MSNDLLSLYEQALAQGTLFADPAQAEVIRELAQCRQALLRPPSLLQRLKLEKQPAVKGLYIWGSVGRGKTQLMDLFFESLPFAAKQREHFHAFMRNIHEALKQYQGHVDPLKQVAKALVRTTRVLCLDECFVDDIGDAMILGNLFAALFDEGLTLITTSNLPPSALYANGLQRSRFLPAIALLEHHCIVHELVAGQDYRRRPLAAHELWLPCPHPGAADKSLRHLWQLETHTTATDLVLLDVNQRKIAALAASPHMAWFRFSDLCAPPRSQQDYLNLAERFHTIILSDIPEIAATDNNSIIYFIYLIDILYDAKVRFIAAAAAKPADIYRQGPMRQSFERTLSRLIEMQSLDYQQGHARGAPQSSKMAYTDSVVDKAMRSKAL